MKFMMLLATGTAFMATALCAYDKPVDTMIELRDLTSEALDQLRNGELDGVAIGFEKGSYIPVELFLKGDILELISDNASSLSIEVKRTFYVKKDGMNFLFSFDLMDWKPLLELVTGSCNLTMEIKNDQPLLRLDADVNHR